MTTTEASPFTAREVLLQHLRRETDLALQLASQMQARAQALASTLTILLALGSILVASKSDVFHEIAVSNLREPAVVALALAGACLLLSLLAAFPRQVPFTDPAWMKATLTNPDLFGPLDDEQQIKSLGPVIQKVDGVEIDAFKNLISANRFRGRVLFLCVLLLAVDGVMIAWLGTELVLRAS